MKRKIHFYGVLAKEFENEVVELDIDNISQMFNGVEQFYDGFKQYVNRNGVKIVIGDEETPVAVTSEEMFNMDLGNIENIHIVPETSGEAPLVLVALPIWLQATIVIGVLVYGFISYKNAKQNGTEEQEENASYLFNGGINRNSENIGLPIVYGETRVGSVVISVGLETSIVDLDATV